MAYLANRFPVAVEPYVGEEIQELQLRGIRIIPGSVGKPDGGSLGRRARTASEWEVLSLQPIRALDLLRALGLAVRGHKRIADLLNRVILRGKESPKRRLHALLHTWLGAYYAFYLQEHGVNHIHVHHGYFGSWIAMVAARLLDVSFSLTLHGSDLLVHSAYLDAKLKNCRFCLTISEFNRRNILQRFPNIDPVKVIVSRLGVDEPEPSGSPPTITRGARHPFNLVTVGRLHAVKDHAFLIRACARLRDWGFDFECRIAGEGPERKHLEALIKRSSLKDRVMLLGHISRGKIESLYTCADLVVLTSRSEGLPLVLMEAMVRGRLVLAPAITGIPELILPGKTGFLYSPGALNDFLEKVDFFGN